MIQDFTVYNPIRKARYHSDPEYRERKKAASMRFRAENLEACRERDRARYAAMTDSEKEACRQGMRERHLKRTYGLTLEEVSQHLTCDICGKKLEPNPRRRVVDHDHVTKQIRGIVCARCNVGIGNLGDNIEGVQNALEYLMAASAQQAYA